MGYAVQTHLRNFPLSSANSADEFGAAIAPYVGENIVESAPRGGAFRASANLRRLNKSSLFYGRFEAPFSVDIPESTRFLHGFPLHGSARHVNNGSEIFDSPDKGAASGPGPLRLTYGGNFEIVGLIMNPDPLAHALSAMLGDAGAVRIRLDRSTHENAMETPTMRGLVQMLIAEVDCEARAPSPILLAELEQAALVAFLCGTKHNYSDRLAAPPRRNAPWQLRRVEEYIEANWNQPLTIEALASLTNSSARSVFVSFKQHRGVSPMAFVKRVRLNHARAMLSRGERDMSVTEVALMCGFGNLGHFAADYIRAFGEKPSQTRKRTTVFSEARL